MFEKVRFIFDGTPCEVKAACTVWSGGKSGDDFKGLPITIRREEPGHEALDAELIVTILRKEKRDPDGAAGRKRKGCGTGQKPAPQPLDLSGKIGETRKQVQSLCRTARTHYRSASSRSASITSRAVTPPSAVYQTAG